LCHIESDFHEIVVNNSSPELFFESSEEIPKPHMLLLQHISFQSKGNFDISFTNPNAKRKRIRI